MIALAEGIGERLRFLIRYHGDRAPAAPGDGA
jgi:hypothetical protein